MSGPTRIAAFALVSVGLIALAAALAPAEPAAPPPPAASAARAVAPAPGVFEIAQRRKGRLEEAATGFLRAFLRYEVGDLPVSVIRSLDLLSTADFGRYLLASPPRQLGGELPAARIVKVETAFLDPDGQRALVRGVARRPDGPEELSFVFVLRGGRWLAARAAE